MAGPTLRLRHRDALHALEAIDLLDVVGEELVRRATGAPNQVGSGRFVPDLGDPASAQELTAVKDLATGRICLIPTPSLQMIGLAGLTALAARQLLPSGMATAAVFGSGAAAQLHLGTLARHVPNVSRASVIYPVGAEPGPSIERCVRDRLDKAEIALSVTPGSRDVVEDSNLLVVAEMGRDRPDLGRLRPGGLLINAARRDLPDEVLAGVDQVYVDDLGLLEHNQHRTFVRWHLAGSAARPEPARQHHDGWPDQPARWRRERRIETDLGHVLTGEGGRANVGDVLLVELFGGASLDVCLGRHIHQAAIALGLGTWVDDAGRD